MNQYEIKFKYMDQYSHGKWNDQQCLLYADSEDEAVKKCIDLYGLGVDCDYEIVSVKKV